MYKSTNKYIADQLNALIENKQLKDTTAQQINATNELIKKGLKNE